MKKILFITGTRADFGKLKPLIREVERNPEFEYSIFVTGMHTLSRYGYTVDEVYRSFEDCRLTDGSRKIVTHMNQITGEPMEMILANTVVGLSRYVHEVKPDMIVIHGDRVEALAGAIVGALRGVLVAHIEGGERSGTIDEVIRHAVTKLSHVHFVANEEAARRLRQLGEKEESIFIIGSPDIDVMMSAELPTLEEVKQYYGIPFEHYAICLFHPVTTDLEGTRLAAKALEEALQHDTGNYVVIYPNNDEGCDLILQSYKALQGQPRFRLFPSLRFESFLVLLREAEFIIGNSSAGVREAPVYGVRSLDIASRQQNRHVYDTIVNVTGNALAIESAIQQVRLQGRGQPSYHFGRGESAMRFRDILTKDEIWRLPTQKSFVDADY